nr:hypothetical protein [Streptomyces coryli]
MTGGGVAYVAGTAGSSGSSAGDGAAKDGDPPPLELDGYGEGAGSVSGAAAIKAAGQLPDGPDEAAVRTAGGSVSRESVARLAKALGVAGKPRQEGGSWLVGTARDGQGPLLRVGVEGPGLWSYERYRAGGDVPCDLPRPVKPGADSPDSSGDTPRAHAICLDAGTKSGGGSSGSGSGASSGTAVGGASTDIAPADPGGDPVSPKAARKALTPVLAAAGQQDAKVDKTAIAYGSMRKLNAQPQVAGLPTYGWETSVMVGPDGKPTSAYGRLSPLDKGHTYPVVSAAKTLEELNKVRGAVAKGTPEEKLRSAPACASAEPDAEGKRSGRAQVCPQPPTELEAPKARSAVFGLSAQSVAGEQVLVPSWIYTMDAQKPAAREPASRLAFPAVDPEFIEYRKAQPPSAAEPPATPEPSRPVPEPSRPEPAPKPTQEPGTPGKARTTMNIESYAISGRTLTVRFWGGVCSDYSATADESGGAVTVRVTGVEKKPGQICVKVAKLFEEKVTLDESLGDRKVVDAADRKAVARK